MSGYVEWYYYPFYGAIIASVLAYYKMSKYDFLSNGFKYPKGFLMLKKRIYAMFFLAFLISSSFHILFPIADIDLPSGQYPVGTQIYDWTDKDRIETYGDQAGKTLRKIKVQAWYPSASTQGFQRLPWIPEGRLVSRKLAEIFYFPPFMLDQSEEVLSNSYLNAPILQGNNPYPVVVISHGWSGFRTLHTDLAELLASHGYIVLGIDHTFGAPVVIFNDGKKISIDGEALPHREASDFQDYAEKFVGTYAADIGFVLDVLTKPDKNSLDPRIRNHLDLNNIGLLGHSTGGGASVEVASTDSRVTAIIGLDPWVEALPEKIIDSGIKSPYLFLRSAEWKGQKNDENLYRLLEGNKQGHLYQITGTTHVDFTMIHMYSSITSLVRLTGSLERNRFENIQEDFVLSFFDKQLQGEEKKQVEDVDLKYQEVYRIYRN